ncbi:head to tail connecting protein [Caudoviricetes sp.]|nr:head to tail connecting protein [Caudoviricetes sp.]
MMADQDQDQDYYSLEEQEDGSAVVDMPEMEMEEQEDGSAIVTIEDGPEFNPDFYDNLADTIDPSELSGLAFRYLDLIETDKEARSLRDKQYEEGIRRTGMGNDAPGGATFMGASKVVHPAMAEGCVDFASRAIKEMFPPDGPVKTKVLGKMDDLKAAKSERKRDYLNWQITEQIEEFKDEQEQLLTQLPLGGSQYFKLWFDETKKRPVVEFLPIDRVILPFAATNFYTAQRAAEVHEITQYEFERRIKNGMYRDINYVKASMTLDQNKVEQANNKVEGKQFEDNKDGLRKVYHIYTYLELEDDKETKGESAPYILMVDELDNQVVGLYRNWEESDKTKTKLDWVVEFKFIPWRGAYAIGLPHLIGGLSAALTGALRALLDTAHINNTATMLKLKGAKISGQSQQVDVTQIVEIEGAPGVQDIRQIAMPMPFNPPSPVLFELLGWLDTAAKGVVTSSEEKIADITSNAPVGTTQALIEQGAAVFSSIHARMHDSQARVLKILCRLNRWHFDEMQKGDVVADLEITRDDFEKNTDVVPVSDPHIFSETQRMAQNQAVLALAEKHPDQFNMSAVLSRMLKQMKVPNINELMKDVPAPEQRTSADENAALLIGQPAYAYLQQDHIAHIQDHLQFALNPFLGQSPFADPNYLNNLIEHLKQHMTLWYLNRSNGYVEKSTGSPVNDYDDPALTSTIDKVYTTVGAHVMLDTQEVFGQFQQALAQIIQMAQQRKNAPQTLPPDAQVVKETSMAETDRKAKYDQARLQLDQKKMQDDMAKHTQDNQTKIAIENAKLTHQTIENFVNAQAQPPMEGQPPADMTAPQPEGVPNGNI